MADKFTRKQFQAQYPDDAACLLAILERRYGKADACPKCGVVGTLTRIEGRRAGTLRSHVVPNELSATLLPIVQANVAPGTKISTDLAGQYKPLKRLGYDHQRVNHQIDEWVRGDIHTNTIEGFWSHLKRGIKSTHASVSKKHLQKYIDEFAFRFNNREAPAEMFQRLLRHVSRAESFS